MNGTIQYTIRPYDTIWMLAQIFNTTVDSIMDLNPGIEPRNLQIGQVIAIRPGFQYYPPYNNGPLYDGIMDENMPYNGSMQNQLPSNGNMRNGGVTNRTPNMGMPDMGMPNMGTPNMGMPDMGMPNMGTPNMGTPDMGMPNGGMPQSGSRNSNMMNGGVPNSILPQRGNMDGGMFNGLPFGDNMMNSAMSELRSYFHMLWEQHVTWSFITFMAMLNNLPQTEVITQRLLRNVNDFADALIPYYGEEEVQVLADLLTNHITIAAELVQAANNQDDAAYNEIEQRWRDNADQIAAYLSSMNPNWHEDDWSAMLNEHLDLLAATIGDMVAQNYESAINRFDDVELQAIEMADMMAEGIMEQFPNM